MRFFELQEILDEELKDPEFRAEFEAERKVLAAERAAEQAKKAFASVPPMFAKSQTPRRRSKALVVVS